MGVRNDKIEITNYTTNVK